VRSLWTMRAFSGL